MSTESREGSGSRSVEGPSAMAAKIRYRFVKDLDPGTTTVALSGAEAVGAGQAVKVMPLTLPSPARVASCALAIDLARLEPRKRLVVLFCPHFFAVLPAPSQRRLSVRVDGRVQEPA